MANPNFPLYIVSKGRADTRFTAKALELAQVPYHIVVEAQEHAAYAAVIDPAKILVLDPAYQRSYDTCDRLGETKSKGPGPARNFAWEHAIRAGFPFHWVMDDNIRWWARLNRNLIVKLTDGSGFRCMEDFCLRYRNIAMAGPNYEMFVPRKVRMAPFILNTRIYSCNLIRNDCGFRWRGRYNEDTDLSLRMLKAGWCTVQFNAFVQRKVETQITPGGNTQEFYAKDGTLPKSRMLVDLHPDVATLRWRFRRWHHVVDYSPFEGNRLVRREGVQVRAGINDYGLTLVRADEGGNVA